MKKFTLMLTLLVLFCSPVVNKFGLLQIGFLSAFDMPADAINADEFEIRISKVTGTAPAPIKILVAPDTLHIFFNYDTPDNLPIGELPFSELYSLTVLNDSSLWDSYQDANVPMKEWISLSGGSYQLIVVAKNEFGVATSGRYDFAVAGSIPIKVFIGIK